MLKKFLAAALCTVSAVTVLTSCGDSKPTGTGQFATVIATANPPAGPLDVDVAKWVDGTTGTAVPVACGLNGARTITPTDASFVVTSTAYSGGSNTTVATSNLQIQKITLTLIPNNSASPDLGPYRIQFPSAGQVIAPGSNTVSIRLAPSDLKSFMISSLGAKSLDCSTQGSILSYRASVSIEAIELNTNRIGTITAEGLVVNFSDFIDQ